MKSHMLSCFTPILCFLLVSGGEQRIRQEPPRSPQAEPGAQPTASGASAPNDAGHGSAAPIAISKPVRVNKESEGVAADDAGNRAAQGGLAVRIELDGTDDIRTLNATFRGRVTCLIYTQFSPHSGQFPPAFSAFEARALSAV
jgi:hypothetical protein